MKMNLVIFYLKSILLFIIYSLFHSVSVTMYITVKKALKINLQNKNSWIAFGHKYKKNSVPAHIDIEN